MGNLHHVKAFTDLGEHYVQGERPGEVYDVSVAHTVSGTHIAVSTGGCICTFLQKDGNATGNTAVKSEIVSSVCCLLKHKEEAADGEEKERLCILGALGNQVYTMEQQVSETIGEPQHADVAAPGQTVSIKRYIPLRGENGYKILTVYQNDDDCTWSLGYFEWNNGVISSAMDTGICMSSPETYWVKQDGEDKVLYQWEGETYVDDPCPSFDGKRLKRRALRLSQRGSRLVGSSEEWCFLADGDGTLGVYPLGSLEDGSSPLWTVETGDKGISEVRVVDAYGVKHLFIYSGETRKLYHCPAVKDLCSGKMVCMPLDTDVLRYSVENGADSIHLCIIKGDELSPKIVHSALLSGEADWIESGVYLESETKLEKLQGHVTDITFCSEDESPVPNQRIRLWTSEETTVYVNGNMLRIGPDMPYLLQGSTTGSLEIVQESDSLNGSVIIFQEVDEHGRAKGPYYTVTPGEKYKAMFKEMDKEDLDQAVTSNGERLVEDDFEGHRSEVLGDAANAMHNMLSGAQVSENEKLQQMKAPYSDGDSALRTVVYQEDPTPYFGKLAGKNGIKSCIIRCGKGKLSYRQVSPEEAFAQMRHTCTAVYGEEGFAIRDEKQLLCAPGDGFFSSIASFFKAVAKGIVSVAEIVIHAVETAVTATVHFIDNMVHQVASFAVKVVKEAVHLVESVLKAVKVGIEKVIQWVGFVFDWKDIQNSAKHIEKEFEEGFDIALQLMDEIDAAADKELETAREKLDSFFKRFREELPDDDQKENAKKSCKDDPVNQADSHNIIKKHLLDGGGVQQELFLELGSDEEAAMEKFVKVMGRFADEGDLRPEEFTDKLKSGKCSLKQIGNALMCVIGTILDHLIEIAEKEIHILIEAGKALINIIKKMLTARIQIPLLSALVKWVTGMDMTMMNLISFAVAVPYTFAYKLMYHKAPVQLEEGKGVLGDGNEGSSLLLSILAGLIGGMQTVKAGLMCAKMKKAIFIPAMVEGVCILGYTVRFLTMSDLKFSKGIGAILIGAAALACCCDIVYCRAVFRTDGSYYTVKLLFCLIGSITALCYWLTEPKEHMLALCIPGGVLFSVCEAIGCCFYRMRPGENWQMVPLVAVLAVVTAVLNKVLLPENSGKNEEYCWESYA